jgi:hypothetical protein
VTIAHYKASTCVIFSILKLLIYQLRNNNILSEKLINQTAMRSAKISLDRKFLEPLKNYK